MKNAVFAVIIVFVAAGCNGDDLDRVSQFAVGDVTFDLVHGSYSDYGSSSSGDGLIVGTPGSQLPDNFQRIYWFYDGEPTFSFGTLDECEGCDYYLAVVAHSSNLDVFEGGAFTTIDSKFGTEYEEGNNYASVYVYQFVPPQGELIAPPRLLYQSGPGRLDIMIRGNETVINLDLQLYDQTHTFPSSPNEKFSASGRFSGSVIDLTDEE